MIERDRLSVISPNNDGESRTIVDIVGRLRIDLRVSKQPWGATLDSEPVENLRDLKPSVAVVEMPSLEAEQQLRNNGHDVILIDHHFYPKLHLDRRKPQASLEQIADLLEYELNRWEKGVAINDRSYIFGLIDAGYSTDEILEIRRWDLQAQGIPEEDIDAIRRAIARAPVQNGITILRTEIANAAFAQDFLVLQDPAVVRDLLVLTGNPIRKAQFYGDPKKVKALEAIGEWTGGSGRSKFWGTNHPDMPEILRRLNL